jgi:NSS family neurotransmitter:Na+ symporter
LIAILIETIAIGWFFDSEKIMYHINHNSILKLGRIWRFFIKYLAPLILSLLLFFQLKKDYLLNYNNYPLIYVLIFGVGIIALPLIIAFLMPRRILDRR